MKTSFENSPSQRGFTFVELMITVAIIGVLVAIAYPSYRESVARSRRADAQVVLGNLAAAMERYYGERTPATYVGATTVGTGAIFPSESPLDGTRKFYDIGVATATTSGYSLTASPKNEQANDRCGTFTLASTGVRGITKLPTGSTAKPEDCWR